mmetsp:Transcript_32732/g.69108  ORF Transcript_32732/g.69108 Transcript_32732/m.69108 type:complete len:128 (-) Transcript_32732:561-944(-)
MSPWFAPKTMHTRSKSRSTSEGDSGAPVGTNRSAEINAAAVLTQRLSGRGITTSRHHDCINRNAHLDVGTQGSKRWKSLLVCQIEHSSFVMLKNKFTFVTLGAVGKRHIIHGPRIMEIIWPQNCWNT